MTLDMNWGDWMRIGVSGRWARYLGAISLALLAAVATAQPGDAEPFRTTLEQMLLAGEHPYVRAPDLGRDKEPLQQLYERHAWQPLWSENGTPTRPALAVLGVLRGAENYGLHSSDYEANLILYHLVDLVTTPGAHPEHWAQFDLALSAAVLRFTKHLHYGRIDPKAAGFDIIVAADRIDRLEVLEEAATATDSEAVFARIEPPYEHYQLLKAALPKFRLLALETGLTDLPSFSGRSVKPGETYLGAPQLRRLLVALGDLPVDSAAPATDLTLDPAVVNALKQFQELHGLAPDGALGKETFRHLTMPLLHRVEQIELTLERWRWLPRLETPPIFVNIPQYRLFAFGTTQDREADMLKLDVIVGKAYPKTRTPVFSEAMRYLVFRPYWDVPYSIATRELLPEIRANLSYLDKQNLEIVSGDGDDAKPVPPTGENLAALASGLLRIRQRPGNDNALGLVKFMLPNEYNVYLHSTPAKGLFREARRAFSHGCIRVSDPVALAEQVLKNEPGDWTREKIEAAMNGTETLRVPLTRPIPVYILYGTAIASEAGNVFFFDDVYGHDARLATLLGE
ncbi:MAG: L,D-transpeptidase family protein [Steroidobacteraceae bacterium]